MGILIFDLAFCICHLPYLFLRQIQKWIFNEIRNSSDGFALRSLGVPSFLRFLKTFCRLGHKLQTTRNLLFFTYMCLFNFLSPLSCFCCMLMFKQQLKQIKLDSVAKKRQFSKTVCSFVRLLLTNMTTVTWSAL